MRSLGLQRFDWFAGAVIVGFAWLVFGPSNPKIGDYEPSGADFQDEGVAPLGWKDLKLLDVESGRAAPELAEFDGQLVRVPGYIVPLEDFQSQTARFLLVPYVGACIHSPPPPANQIVSVKMRDGPVEFQMWETYWIRGRFYLEDVESPYGPAAFHMQGLGIDPFEAPE